MSKKLYLECYAGISGDMMVASLLDLGADKDVLEKALKSLPINGFDIKISRVVKVGLDMCDFDVILDNKHENHDHDMEYLHGDRYHKHDRNHEHPHDHDHNHSHDHEHTHDHDHDHNHSHENEHEHPHSHDHEHGHSHDHRGLPDILDIIDRTEITDNAKSIAVKTFEIIARAEAKAHGLEIDKVHFHEVGAVDSIVDIVSVAVCLDNLAIEEVVVPVMYEGKGFVRCQHGVIPIPGPAVSNIASENGLALHIMDVEGEFITPTGAAIVAAIKTSDALPRQFSIKKIGMGAGKRNYERASILRAMLIEDESKEKDIIYKLESNIDDCTGEALGYTMDKLFEAGARDVNYMSVFMKKNRPAYQLNVICKEEDIDKLEKIIFEETTSIGIRRQKMERSILKRNIKTINTSMGDVDVKVCELDYGMRFYPEYSSVIELCKKHNMPYQEVYNMIVREAHGKL
ncbi:hypothetical protein SAMN02745751_00568 [Dethiosulfatibacter aminovorans DSM 17477]|uniref:Pyridinium-3,5-bisthiocarboxylic acid mononucleotide nickel insertion protein n=1 Tax=Dethiosulfatibacter aminovorans DSM 17477 TaxID=1121476 RepID=A0A1M6C4B1_9FIRM|nr:nickel pincer cofactor biosynthesis protein LarC [Dethiosulfatibacter aminovorans]SHI55574.1 hypothetical protein SAMN02745751_00568 [Dethiosulfatibacter aminovorans DSM 17477]